jgi:energy-coupling factor transporter ATP-binding protein EcfA2
VAAAPNRDEFGYFGYLKKMTLTLHNIKMMKAGLLPFHGALVKIVLNQKASTVLIVGDTGAGKSETLEAFRVLGDAYIQDMIIVADDMGAIQIDADGDVIGYGTEVGAFVRLDDLQPGYAFGQIDRAIIMSPSQINARAVLPVTTYANVVKGHKIDLVLYANNYEEIDQEHPIIERFSQQADAIRVFRSGAVMSKGTTTSTGLVHSYFANIFGPPEYQELHETLAERYFERFFSKGVFVGQIRTRLGIAGWETKGPEDAAKALIGVIQAL